MGSQNDSLNEHFIAYMIKKIKLNKCQGGLYYSLSLFWLSSLNRFLIINFDCVDMRYPMLEKLRTPPPSFYFQLRPWRTRAKSTYYTIKNCASLLDFQQFF